MNLNGKGAQEIAIASDLLVARLGELLIGNGIITTNDAAMVINAAKADALGPQGWQTLHKAAEIVEEVGRIWAHAKA